MVDLHEMITKCELHWQPNHKRVLSMQQYNKLTFSAYNALLDMKDHAWEKSVNSNVFVIASRPWTCLGENMRLAMEKSVMRRLMFIQSITYLFPCKWSISSQLGHCFRTFFTRKCCGGQTTCQTNGFGARNDERRRRHHGGGDRRKILEKKRKKKSR